MVDLLTAASKELPREREDGDEPVDIELSAAYRNAKKELHSLDAVETPYGPLMDEFEFVEDEPCFEGDFPTIEYISPFALLFHLASVSNEFFSFFVRLGTSSHIFVCRRGVSW